MAFTVSAAMCLVDGQRHVNHKTNVAIEHVLNMCFPQGADVLEGLKDIRAVCATIENEYPNMSTRATKFGHLKSVCLAMRAAGYKVISPIKRLSGIVDMDVVEYVGEKMKYWKGYADAQKDMKDAAATPSVVAVGVDAAVQCDNVDDDDVVFVDETQPPPTQFVSEDTETEPEQMPRVGSKRTAETVPDAPTKRARLDVLESQVGELLARMVELEKRMVTGVPFGQGDGM
jgi:hypothetical protein